MTGPVLGPPSRRAKNWTGLDLKALSLNESLTPSSPSSNTKDETSSEDSWAEVLESDWQGRGMLGSDTSFDSELSEDSWAEVLGSDWWGRGMLGSDTLFDLLVRASAGRYESLCLFFQIMVCIRGYLLCLTNAVDPSLIVSNIYELL